MYSIAISKIWKIFFSSCGHNDTQREALQRRKTLKAKCNLFNFFLNFDNFAVFSGMYDKQINNISHVCVCMCVFEVPWSSPPAPATAGRPPSVAAASSASPPSLPGQHIHCPVWRNGYLKFVFFCFSKIYSDCTTHIKSIIWIFQYIRSRINRFSKRITSLYLDGVWS